MLRSIQFCFSAWVYLSSWGIICHQFSGSSRGVSMSVRVYTRLLLWRFSWYCASKNIFLKRSWTLSALYGVFGLALFQGTAETEKKKTLTLRSVGSYSFVLPLPGGAKAHRAVCDAITWWCGSVLPSDSWAVLILQSWEIRDGILTLHNSRTCEPNCSQSRAWICSHQRMVPPAIWAPVSSSAFRTGSHECKWVLVIDILESLRSIRSLQKHARSLRAFQGHVLLWNLKENPMSTDEHHTNSVLLRGLDILWDMAGNL